MTTTNNNHPDTKHSYFMLCTYDHDGKQFGYFVTNELHVWRLFNYKRLNRAQGFESELISLGPIAGNQARSTREYMFNSALKMGYTPFQKKADEDTRYEVQE